MTQVVLLLLASQPVEHLRMVGAELLGCYGMVQSQKSPAECRGCAACFQL